MSQYITKLETLDGFSWKFIFGGLLNFANIRPLPIFVWTQTTIADTLHGRWGRRNACTHTGQHNTTELSKMRTISSFMSQAGFELLYRSKTGRTFDRTTTFSWIGDDNGNLVSFLVPCSRGPGFMSWPGNGLLLLRFSYLPSVSGDKFRLQFFLSTFFTITPCTLPLLFGTASRIRF
jgi:hypothetical protein